MSRLALRHGRVAVVSAHDDQTAELVVDIGGEGRPARADVRLLGPMAVGDEVVVNVAARDLGLGSGGVDIVHVNLTRGLDGRGQAGAHVMKLNYTSVQHAVLPLEERSPSGPSDRLDHPVAVLALHGQLAPVVWAATQTAPGARIGYVQTAGGALPAGHLRDVAELRARGLLTGTVTAAPAYGGEEEAMTVAGGLHGGLTTLGWDAAVVGPGPGIVGSGTALGHGGLAALDNAHAALALGCRTIVVPRMSSADPRVRHRGVSHHTEQVLRLVLAPVVVALAEGVPFAEVEGEDARRPPGHDVRAAAVDLSGYHRSALPARTMGRTLVEDPLFFRAALAGGVVLGRELAG